MSVHVMSWAWRQPIKDDGDFRLLLALADLANDDGESWPSLTSLRERMGGVSQSTVQRRVRRLTDAGLLAVEQRSRENGSRTSNLYRLFMEGQGVLVIGDQGEGSAGDQGVLPELVTRPDPPEGRSGRRTDLSFEALVEVTRSNVSSERGPINRALQSIREVWDGSEDDLPAEIRRRAAEWPNVYGDATLTATALSKHWLRCDGSVRRISSRGMTPEQIMEMDL